MDPIKKNIAIFGDERYAFLEVLKQYSDAKVAYDGAISAYGRVDYGTRIYEGKGGTVPVRHQFSYSELMETPSFFSTIPEALGFEFEIPLRRGFKANYLVELFPWDYQERLASVTMRNVFYNSPDDQSEHDILFTPGQDEYVFVTVVLNKEHESDFGHPDTFLQHKLLKYLEDRTPVTNRLFLLRVKQVVWAAESELIDIIKNFEVRDDSVILEILD